jgi:site-specific recombinase XerD
MAWTWGDGPLAPFAEGYRAELVRQGYTHSSVKNHVLVMGQLSRWLSAQGLGAADLDRTAAAAFLAARRAGGQRRVPSQRTLDPLFDHLRGQHVLPPVETTACTPVEELLGRYREHLVKDRGLAPLTVVRYERMARRFLTRRSSTNGGAAGAEGLSGVEVTAYLLEQCSRLAVESAKREAADLRALLRFLYLHGLIGTDLGVAVPPVAGWRDTRLPPTLTTPEVAALLESCDRSRPAGLRDFAILNLLARLGLRSGEVAALQLGDVDWRAGEILVRGKARRDDRLPLPADVGEALVAYLRKGRPRAECRNLILTCYAPVRAIHPSSITNVVYRACRRAGLARVGGHRLRHALATEMLRQGGDLVEIGQVLRHQDLATTSVYAKVDRAALRSVAQPWPGVER